LKRRVLCCFIKLLTAFLKNFYQAREASPLSTFETTYRGLDDWYFQEGSKVEKVKKRRKLGVDANYFFFDNEQQRGKFSKK